MDTYMVTGCAGFIGSQVCRTMLREGHRVVGVDNLNDSCDPLLKRWRLKEIGGGNRFQFHQLDIQEERMRELFRDCRPAAIVHLAARAGVRVSVEQPRLCYESNVMGTLNLLQSCVEFGVGKFVLASSSSLYGEHPPPFREDLPTDRPLSPYAASKKAAETLCFCYHRLHGLDVTMLRYFTVYGPAGRPDMAPFRFVQRICEGRPITVYGDGSQTRDFTFVDDIARGTLLGLKPVGCETFNLGGGQSSTVLSLIGMIEELAGMKARLEFLPRHSADPPATRAAVDKARRRLGWSPRVGLREGLLKLLEWYRAQREWASKIGS